MASAQSLSSDMTPVPASDMVPAPVSDMAPAPDSTSDIALLKLQLLI